MGCITVQNRITFYTRRHPNGYEHTASNLRNNNSLSRHIRQDNIETTSLGRLQATKMFAIAHYGPSTRTLMHPFRVGPSWPGNITIKQRPNADHRQFGTPPQNLRAVMPEGCLIRRWSGEQASHTASLSSRIPPCVTPHRCSCAYTSGTPPMHENA